MIKLYCDSCGALEEEEFHTGTIEASFTCDKCKAKNQETFTYDDWKRVLEEGKNFKPESKELNGKIIDYFSNELYGILYEIDCLEDLSEDSIAELANYLSTRGPDVFEAIKEDGEVALREYESDAYSAFWKEEDDLYSSLTL